MQFLRMTPSFALFAEIFWVELLRVRIIFWISMDAININVDLIAVFKSDICSREGVFFSANSINNRSSRKFPLKFKVFFNVSYSWNAKSFTKVS